MTPLELKTFVARLRVLSTSFTTAYGERKHHLLLTTTPSAVSVPDEADQLSAAAYDDFLRSVTACCDAALAGVVPAPKAPDLPVGCYISADVPPDVASYATPLLRYLRHYVVIDTASTLGVIRDLSFDDTRHYRVTFSHLHKTWSAYLARAAVRDWVRLHPITTDFDLTPEVLADR